MVPERYRAGQELSPHFDHLHASGHELMVLSRTLDEYARGLAGAIRGDDVAESVQGAEAFRAYFVRQRGLDRPATPIMVEELRRLTATPDEPAGPDIVDLAAELRNVVVRERRRKGARPPRDGLSARSPKAPGLLTAGERETD